MPKKLKVLTVILGLVLSFNTSVFALNTHLSFPLNPQPSLTPGALCNSAGTTRYPERIPYCDREVSSERKDLVVERYDAAFGYKIEQIGRRNFKIDHYIPLCMGGSNEPSNLWPQHPSVYEITDPLEPALCQKMAEGRMKQAEAVRLIKQAKNDLSQAPRILETLKTL